MNAYISPSMPDIIAKELGRDWSHDTVTMFWNIITDWTDSSNDRWDILPQMKLAIAGDPTKYGAEFAERVEVAMSFTPSPFEYEERI